MATLNGKVAIITGAASPRGIGFAMARKFVAEGASVFLVDLDAQSLAQRIEELSSLAHSDARAVLGSHDLATAGALEAIAEEALSHFGRIDILCNNAAIRINKPFEEFTRQDFDRAIAINLAAPFFLSQAVVPVMRAQGGGRIINTASQLGTVAYETRAVYGLTKAALIHLTKSMALELAADGILVNSISPGPVYTQPIVDREAADPDGTRARLRTYVPTGRYGEPDEIADVALFLATSSPGFLQGENIVVDGGYTLH
jgi:NAD(P)-dependent dehydrogenase (short-subunit alcohol dehydrogenase family)